jgi:large subunit ribosomal protein L32
MAVPKRRKGKASTRARTSLNTKMTMPNLSECTNCGSMKRSHVVCPQCGFYKNKEVIRNKD